jgi:hypothetical protein
MAPPAQARGQRRSAVLRKSSKEGNQEGDVDPLEELIRIVVDGDIRDLTKTSGVRSRMPFFGEVWDHLWD